MESQVFAPCFAEKSHLDCSETAQAFKRWGTQSSVRQQPPDWSATSFIISTWEAYRMKDHVKPLSDEASGGSACAPWQLWSPSHLLHRHFAALTFSANIIWITEAWAAPRRCPDTHSRVTELRWECRFLAPRCVVLPCSTGQCLSFNMKRAATQCSAQLSLTISL